jgi:hypothetical protein
MPDEIKNEITLKDLFEKQIKIETMLQDIMNKLSSIAPSDIIEDEEPNPFRNPETGLDSVKYYYSQHPKDDERKS